MARSAGHPSAPWSASAGKPSRNISQVSHWTSLSSCQITCMGSSWLPVGARHAVPLRQRGSANRSPVRCRSSSVRSKRLPHGTVGTCLGNPAPSSGSETTTNTSSGMTRRCRESVITLPAIRGIGMPTPKTQTIPATMSLLNGYRVPVKNPCLAPREGTACRAPTARGRNGAPVHWRTRALRRKLSPDACVR